MRNMASSQASWHSTPTCRAVVATVAALMLLGLVGSASAATPNFKAVSANGEVVFFETDEQLVPGDTDTKRDVYERYFNSAVGQYVTREVSLGPTGGNDAYPAQFEAANAAGTRVFFSTEERLVGEDTDRQVDIYMRDLSGATPTTTLVSKGEAACWPGCGNGAFPTTFAGINEAGTEAFFTTGERLGQEDKDSSDDLYVRKLTGGGETELVSNAEAGCGGGCGDGEFDVSILAKHGISADGSHAYFTTAEPLSSADGDTALDIYSHDVENGKTELVSRGECPGCVNEEKVPVFDGSSADGDRVFFTTDEKLLPGDDDGAADVYARDLPNGPTTLISGGSEKVTASFAAASADGSHVFFTSVERLGGGDSDNANDIYEWTEGAPLDLVTTSTACSGNCGVSFDAVRADSSEVIFNTAEALSPEDQDTREDVYEEAVGGGSPVLVSRGESSCLSCWSGAFDANFNEASADASRVIFSTEEGVLEEDTDGEDDIYLRDLGGGSTSLITTSPSFCPLKKGNCGAIFVGASEDGRHVYFRTFERFTLEDGDNEADIYERFLGATPSQDVTRLVSTGNSPDLELGPPSPDLTATDPASPASSRTPRVVGEAEAGSAVKIYSTPDCSGEPVASGTAAELRAPGLEVSVPAGSVTSFRATAEAEGFVSNCSEPITYRQTEESKSEGGGTGEGSGDRGTSATVTARPPASTGSGQAPGPTYLIPHTLITFAPGAKTHLRSPVFRFTDSTGQGGTSFRCKVDRQGWKPCSSPLRLKRLHAGKHTLEVLAVNGAGAAEPQATKRSFRVVPR